MKREKKMTVLMITAASILNLTCLIAHYVMLRLRDRKRRALQKIVEDEERKINEEWIKGGKKAAEGRNKAAERW